MRGLIVGALACGAVAAGFMALPEGDAARYNADIQQGCAQMRAARPAAECPPTRREDFRTDWLLIAAVFGVGSAVAGMMGQRHG